jgi:hypothetical protein
MNKFVAPRGINHLLLNVRDIEESHGFRLDTPKADSRLRPQSGRIQTFPVRSNPNFHSK